jgi:4-oxalomesaconate hydratase
MAAQEYLWEYYTRVALNRGVQAARNSNRKEIKYAEAYQRIFPQVTDELS